MTDTTIDEIDEMTEIELRHALRTFIQITMRLGDVTDDESRITILRMLTSTDPNVPLPDLRGMVIRTLDERDRLRERIGAALARLDRLSGHSYTAAILRGEA